MSKLEIGYGHNTFAYLEGCAKCGKPYHPDANWRTTYTAAKESNMVIWLLFCEDCWENWPEVSDDIQG